MERRALAALADGDAARAEFDAHLTAPFEKPATGRAAEIRAQLRQQGVEV